MIHSGSVAWPASSIKMCVKWLRGKQAETNLGKEFWNRNVKSSPGYNPSRIYYKTLFGFIIVRFERNDSLKIFNPNNNSISLYRSDVKKRKWSKLQKRLEKSNTEVKLSWGLGPTNTDHNVVIWIHALHENSSSIGRTEVSLEQFFICNGHGSGRK